MGVSQSLDDQFNLVLRNLTRVVSRADYQKVLMQKALEVGAYIGRAAEVVEIDDSVNPYNVILKDGRRLIADVVVGADGRPCFPRDSYTKPVLINRSSFQT